MKVMRLLVLVLMILAAAVNVLAVILSFNVVGLQILPALCAAFAIYLSMYQWSRLQSRAAGA